VSLSKALAHLEQAESDGVVLPAFPAVDSLDAFFENYDNAAFRAAVSYKAELPAVAQAALV
jgi:hypothetical protein